MKRTKKVLGGGMLAVAVALVVAWSIRPPQGMGKAQPRVSDPKPAPLVMTAGAYRQLASADPIGSARLEGQVIDAQDRPVDGALVTIDALPPQTTTTEADGGFVFERLLERQYTVVAVAPDGVAGPVRTRLGAATEPLVLKLRPAASVDVTVIDARSAAPIRGATVEVRAPIAAVETTGDTGAVVLASVVPGRWPLVVSAPGYATAFDTVNASPTATRKLAIALHAGVRARGSVVDAAGKPVAGAIVWLDSVSDWIAAPDPARDGVQSGADGSFSIQGVARGSYVVHAIAPDRATGVSGVVNIDADVDGIVVRLAAGARLAGRVVRGGRSASGAAVRGWWPDGHRITHADAEGRFQLESIPVGTTLWLSASDGEASSKPKAIDLSAADPAELVLVLDQDGTIAGIVVDRAGTPVEGAQISGVYADTSVSGVAGSSTIEEISDSSGRFRLRGLLSGTYQLAASRDPLRVGRASRTMAATGSTDVKLVVEASGLIKGRVAFKTGGAPAAYRVRVGRNGLPTAFTAAAFTIEAPLGSQALWIDGPGFTAVGVDGVEVNADAVADAGTIELDRGRTLRGRVTSADGGAPPAGAEVIAGGLLAGTGQRVDTGDGGPNFRSDVKRTSVAADGSFELQGVASTPVSVIATAATGVRSSPAAVPAGHDDIGGLALVLKNNARLAGTVTKGGTPVRAIVNAQAWESPLAMLTVMTTDGAYRFDELAPGRYTVAAISGQPLAGSPFYPRSIELAPGAAATLDLAMTPGNAVLTVRAPGIETGLVFVTTRPGEATTARALLGELGRQDGGQWAMAPIRGDAVTLHELAQGPARVCAVRIPAKTPPTTSALVEQIVRAGGSLAATCAAVQLTTAATVTLEGSK